MNSRDLTLASINGEAERVPFNPFIMHLAASIDGIDYCNHYCQNAEILANAQIKCAKTFGIDHVNVSTDAFREASAWGLETDFSGHTPVAKGALSVDEFDSLSKPDLNSAPRIQDRINAVKHLNEHVGEEQCIVGWIEAPFAEICCLFGLVNISKMAREDDWEERIKSLIERILPTQLEFAKLQIEAGADIIILCPLVSWEQAYEVAESIKPFDQREAEEILPCPVPCSQGTYILRVKGASMEPKFHNGDLIFVDPNADPESGKYVVIQSQDSDEAAFKQLIIEGGQKYLEALNPDWPNRIVEFGDTTRICGVVVFKGEKM